MKQIFLLQATVALCLSLDVQALLFPASGAIQLKLKLKH